MYPWGSFDFNSVLVTREVIACLTECDHGSENSTVPYAESI